MTSGALRSLKDEASAGNRGTLTIGTTHTQARYVLPRVIPSFVKAYPDIELILKEGDPEGICQMVDAGVADLAVGTETSGSFPHLVKLPCFEITRSVVAKADHPSSCQKAYPSGYRRIPDHCLWPAA